MAGPNTILNHTRGDAGYKSTLSPNDDHHLEHIFRAHCWMYGCPEAASFTRQLIDLTWKSPLKGGMLKASFKVSLREN